MTRDAQGNAVSGGTPDSVERLDQAIRALTIGHGDPLALLDAAAAASPGMPMPLIAKAWIFAIPLDPTLAVMAGDLAARAGTLAMNQRERALLGAVELMLSGERRASITALDAHLLDHPRDVLAHFVALYGDTLLGRGHRIRDRAARASPFWSPDTPGIAAFRACRSFGLEEAGDYGRAEAEARAAIALEPHLYLGHHTVAHCLEMTGRPRPARRGARSGNASGLQPKAGGKAICGGIRPCSTLNLASSTRRWTCMMGR